MQSIERLSTLTIVPVRLVTPLLVAVVLAACAVGGGSSEAQKPTGTQSDPQAAAKRALVPLQQLVNGQTYRDMGFDDPSEVKNATLAEPIRVALVRLDALRRYQTGGDPLQLLTDISRLIYPVAVKDQVKSSIIVERVAGEWKPTSLGRPRLARQIARFKSEVSAQQKPASDSMNVVHVAALNLYFLGYRVDGRLMLTPLENYTFFKLDAGAALRADDVFATLAPFARQHKGLPL